jgi:hypothetical protein
MKVLKPDAIPVEPANSPLFTGAPVTRQTLLTPEMSNYFNLAVVNFSAGARNKMHTQSSDQVLFVTAARVSSPQKRARRSSAWVMSCTLRRKRNIGMGPRLIPHSPTLR